MALGGGCIRQVSDCGIILERFWNLVGFSVAFIFCGALAQLKQKTTKKHSAVETKAADELVGDVQCYSAGLDWEERQNPPFSTVLGLFPPAPCIVHVALFRKPFIPTS